MRTFLLLLLSAAAGLAAAPARADGDRAARVPLLPAYVQECGSCHVAFAPALLPAASWQRLMAGLGRHYGSDASLDAATTASIAAWLQAHAGSGKRTAEAPRDDRLTQGAWFQREHREVRGRFGSAAVKGASDCAACHTRAAEGSYREREIRLPG
ncbi:MAG: cytochrome C [Rubrivivax sp.]